LAATLEREGAEVSADGDLLIVRGRSSAEVGELAFAAGLPLHELSAEVASLEEVFFQLTSDGDVGEEK
jgi:ABC-2 type transport system ATP-binding protein